MSAKNNNETVKVMVRCRPMNQNEIKHNSKSCVKIQSNDGSVIMYGKEGERQFTYDNVFATDETQETIYNKSAFSLVESVVSGYNGTIFAYGQTGCGKTHTMMGYSQNETEKGIIPRTFDQIIKIIKQQEQGINYLVRCSFIEIYNEEIHDLLSKDIKQKLDLKENQDKGVYIKDLSMICVKTVEEMEFYMNKGNGNRTTGETLMNKDSSRSHSIFTVYVEQSQIDEKGNERITLGKLNLVDLAGSERLSKTGAQGDRLKEATKINLSLSALGNVIQALVDGKSSYIPYRDSKLTRLLQDSLGGNTKTIMIAAISPADYNYDETLGTLRYASRAKNIKNKPKVNEDPKDALLKEYAEEIKKLKSLLQNQNNGQQIAVQNVQGNIGSSNSNSNNNNNNNNNNDNSNNNEMGNSQLRLQNEEIENQLNNEKQEKQKLEQMIQELKSNMVQGGGADESQKKQYQDYKEQLEKQEQEHQLLIAEKQEQEEEFLMKEFSYQNMQEEVEHLRKMSKKLRRRYEEQQLELRDAEYEQIRDKEDLTDTFRIQEKEIKLYKQILKYVFKKDELKVIKNSSIWNENKSSFTVPPFIFRDKQLRFPKLGQQQGLDLMEGEKDNRDVELKIVDTPSNKQSSTTNNCNQNNVNLNVSDEFKDYNNNKQGQYKKINNNRRSNVAELVHEDQMQHKINKFIQEQQNEHFSGNQAKQNRKIILEPIRNSNNFNNQDISRNSRNQKCKLQLYL